jgi:hypothetical protein
MAYIGALNFAPITFPPWKKERETKKETDRYMLK